MNDFFLNSIYFGVALSLGSYYLGVVIKNRTRLTICNPLLIAMILIIAVLKIFHIDYETYDYGAKYITFFLTPATVCLAVPLYRQVTILKQNKLAVLLSIFAGCMAHLIVVLGMGAAFQIDRQYMISLLSKSVTTPIAIGVTQEMGGIPSITVIGVVFAGMLGAVIASFVCRLFKITEPAAQGLGIGCASHAVGTSKAVEMGDVQAAMSSLAIVVTGLMTVIIVPIVVKIFL